MSTLIAGERYEFVSGRSDKFWEWRLFERGERNDSWELRFTWGRRGTNGQQMSEWYTSKDLALWKARARSNDKLAHGYSAAGAELARQLATASLNQLRKPYRTTTRVPPRAQQDVQKTEPPPIVTVRRVKLRD